jgi:hypothetical protein
MTVAQAITILESWGPTDRAIISHPCRWASFPLGADPTKVQYHQQFDLFSYVALSMALVVQSLASIETEADLRAAIADYVNKSYHGDLTGTPFHKEAKLLWTLYGLDPVSRN